MDLLEIKIVTFGDITGNPNLTIAEKLQLLNFVKEATELQLVSLLKTGRMKTEKEVLTEQPDQEEYSKFLKNRINSIKQMPAGEERDNLVRDTGEHIAARGEIGGSDQRIRQHLVSLGLMRAKERQAAKASEPSTLDTATKWAQDNPGEAAAIAAGAAAAITAGVLTYKRFFSKAAKACKGKSGEEKTSCMKLYKAQGKQSEVGVLTAKLSGCKGNPKCINKIKSRIASVKQDIQSLKTKK